MAKSAVTNTCDECGRTFADDSSHFRGSAVNDHDVMRCVLHDMFILALAVQTLKEETWNDCLQYHLFPPEDRRFKRGTFDQEELVRIAALIKMRILYDFLYADKTGDDFQAAAVPAHLAKDKRPVPRDLSAYGVTRCLCKNQAAIDKLADNRVFTKKAISKYIAHLLEERILKPKCVPQVKFVRGRKTTIKVAMLLLEDAEAVVRKVIDSGDFSPLKGWAAGYWKVYQEAVARIRGKEG